MPSFIETIDTACEQLEDRKQLITEATRALAEYKVNLMKSRLDWWDKADRLQALNELLENHPILERLDPHLPAKIVNAFHTLW